MKRKLFAITLAAILLLAGCGAGSLNSKGAENSPSSSAPSTARSRAAAYLVSCLLFALLHVWQFAVVNRDLTYFLLMVQYLVPGLVLAWAYEHSGTLWASVALHAVANALSVWLTV